MSVCPAAGPIFDTHAHYASGAFNADRFQLLDSLPALGVTGVCEQATHSGDAPRCLELAHRYPWVWAAIGIHPESLLPADKCGSAPPAPTVSVYGGDWAAEMRALAPLYDDPKVVAVGECGLDYHWPVPKDAQLALFEAEIRLALELDKPIVVHDREAHADVYALLKLLFRQRRGRRLAGGAGHAAGLWGRVYLQGGQAGRPRHRRAAPREHPARDRLPLYGPRTPARPPLRQLDDRLCGRVYRPAQGRRGRGRLCPDRRQRPPGVRHPLTRGPAGRR